MYAMDVCNRCMQEMCAIDARYVRCMQQTYAIDVCNRCMQQMHGGHGADQAVATVWRGVEASKASGVLHPFTKSQLAFTESTFGLHALEIPSRPPPKT